MSAVGPVAFSALFWGLLVVLLVVFAYEVYVLGRGLRDDGL